MKGLTVMAAAVALVVGVAVGSYSVTVQDNQAKYKAGECLVSQNSPQAYFIEAVKDGHYKGVHVMIMFGVELNMPVVQLQADKSLVKVNCETGEPVK